MEEKLSRRGVGERRDTSSRPPSVSVRVITVTLLQSQGETDPWTKQRLILYQAALLFSFDFLPACCFPAEPHNAFLIWFGSINLKNVFNGLRLRKVICKDFFFQQLLTFVDTRGLEFAEALLHMEPRFSSQMLFMCSCCPSNTGRLRASLILDYCLPSAGISAHGSRWDDSSPSSQAVSLANSLLTHGFRLCCRGNESPGGMGRLSMLLMDCNLGIPG